MKWLTYLTGLFDKLPWERIQRLVLNIATRKPVAVGLSSLLLTISLALAWMYHLRSSNYESVVRRTLSAELMATPQSFKGLEAFVLSTVDDRITQQLQGLTIGPEFARVWRALETTLLAFNPATTASAKLRRAKGDNRGLILTDDISPGFLFLPVNALRPTLTSEDLKFLDPKSKKADVDVDQIIQKAIKGDSELLKDVAFTACAAAELQEVVKFSIADGREPPETSALIDTKPTQAYIITKNGVNRIFNNYNENPEAQYGSQFPATTFFPSRPYFWPTIDARAVVEGRTPTQIASEPVAKFFWVSPPYIDLGGNGIVVTMARGVDVDGLPRSVVCLDLKVQTKAQLQSMLEKQVGQFGEKVSRIKCKLLDAGNCNCTSLDDSHADGELESKMRAYVAQRHHKRSEVFGNIQIIQRGRSNDGADSALIVSVPQSEDSGPGHQTGEFLVFKLDLTRFRRHTTLIALGAATAFGLFSCFIVFLWATSIRSEQSWQEALARVEGVLKSSPIAYVRLNSRDEIVYSSGEFRTLVGRSEDQLRNVAFGSLCADSSSADRYTKVQSLRTERKAVEPYELDMRVGNGTAVRVLVTSADVPSRHSRGLPETFGILVRKTG